MRQYESVLRKEDLGDRFLHKSNGVPFDCKNTQIPRAEACVIFASGLRFKLCEPKRATFKVIPDRDAARLVAKLTVSAAVVQFAHARAEKSIVISWLSACAHPSLSMLLRHPSTKSAEKGVRLLFSL
jgi:hypothetical protein